MRRSYLTFSARDVAAMARFHIDGLGLDEVEALGADRRCPQRRP